MLSRQTECRWPPWGTFQQPFSPLDNPVYPIHSSEFLSCHFCKIGTSIRGRSTISKGGTAPLPSTPKLVSENPTHLYSYHIQFGSKAAARPQRPTKSSTVASGQTNIWLQKQPQTYLTYLAHLDNFLVIPSPSGFFASIIHINERSFRKRACGRQRVDPMQDSLDRIQN